MEKIKINNDLIRKIKNTFMEYYNKNSRAVTLKDIKLILECYKNGNYEPVYDTNLYVNHGGDYCRLLEIINRIVGGNELI